MLTTMHFNGRNDYSLQEQKLKQFRQYDRLRSKSLFYVIGTVSGQEDPSPDHKIATARALAVQAWLEKRGVNPERIFAYVAVPEPQTPYGNGNAEAYLCNNECPCPRFDFNQQIKTRDRNGFAPEYPVAPK